MKSSLLTGAGVGVAVGSGATVGVGTNETDFVDFLANANKDPPTSTAAAIPAITHMTYIIGFFFV